MELLKLQFSFTVCKLSNIAQLNLENEFTFVSNTDDEISLVCPFENVPSQYLAREDGWCCYRIQGILDFSLIGIISKISNILAQNHIAVFVISTYNTDYIFVKEFDSILTEKVLMDAGYPITINF